MQFFHWRAARDGAWITITALLGGMVAGIVAGDIVFNLLPGHSINNPSPVHIAVAALPALAGFLGGSALWGIRMGRLAGTSNRKRMALAGALGFTPVTLAVTVGLGALEPIAVESLGAQYPIHRIFTFLFVPSAFLIAGVSAWAIGRGLQDATLANKLLFYVGTSAALTFLAMNLLMESLGWQVGAPNAEERLTMVTVLLASNFAAAVVGGAVMGLVLTRQSLVWRTQMQTKA